MFSGADDATIDYAKNASPQKRMGLPNDIGDAVALIASESARWISGQSILVNGNHVNPSPNLFSPPSLHSTHIN
jgi:NAD(P)-dependent dehydrogenase (short-subunit alcohol dehydrogenase family)